MIQRFFFPLSVSMALLFLSSSCGKKDDNKHENNMGSSNQVISQKIDLRRTYGLLLVDDSSAVSRHLSNAKYLGVKPKIVSPSKVRGLQVKASSNSDGGLKKIDASGKISSSIETRKEEWAPTIPNIRTIGVSDQGDVYLQYERNFVYREVDDNGVRCTDPWAQSSPCSCQIFRVKGTLAGYSSGSITPAWNNVECVDYNHVINNWQVQNKVFQFDRTGNVYYLAQLPDSPKSVLYRLLRQKSEGHYQLQEVVNSNICVRDFIVTKNGGVFYIGETCSGENGFQGGSGSFFRYVMPITAENHGVVEISRNWWQYTFEPIVGETTDMVVFYGPDPEPVTETIASWNSACLFEFDPNLDIGERSDQLVTCNNDIWSWLQLSRSIDINGIDGDADHPAYGSYNPWNNPPYVWRNEYKNRCTSQDNTFIGSNSGNPIRNIKQDSQGNSYVVGDISIKKAGTYSCNVNIKGPYCLNSLNQPIVDTTTAYTEETCTEISGATWKKDGWCENGSGGNPSDCRPDASGGLDGNGNSTIWHYNNSWFNSITYVPADTSTATEASGTICVEQGLTQSDFDAISDTSTSTSFYINGSNCQSPPSTGGNDSWTDQYKGLALVDKVSKELVLKSTKNEQVVDMWIVNDTIYYTSYSQSVYRLRKVTDGVNNKTLLSQYEAYNVALHPSGDGTLLIDGLDFTDNSYTLGKFDESEIPADPDAAALGANASSRGQPPVAQTGQVKQMVIMGSGN